MNYYQLTNLLLHRLVLLTEDNLKALGVESLGHRIELMVKHFEFQYWGNYIIWGLENGVRMYRLCNVPDHSEWKSHKLYFLGGKTWAWMSYLNAFNFVCFQRNKLYIWGLRVNRWCIFHRFNPRWSMTISKLLMRDICGIFVVWQNK